MTYSFSLCNGVYLLRQEQLGLAVGLKGNGMCFSTRGLSRVPWSAHGLTEDLEFSWMLRVSGERIYFLPESLRIRFHTIARRWRSCLPAPPLGSRPQRPQAKFFYTFTFLAKAYIAHKYFYLIDLILPPMVPLILCLFASIGLQLSVIYSAGSNTAATVLSIVQCSMVFILACYALCPFFKLGLPMRYLSSLKFLPCYAVWKLLVVATGKVPTVWVRTPREPVA